MTLNQELNHLAVKHKLQAEMAIDRNYIGNIRVICGLVDELCCINKVSVKLVIDSWGRLYTAKVDSTKFIADSLEKVLCLVAKHMLKSGGNNSKCE